MFLFWLVLANGLVVLVVLVLTVGVAAEAAGVAKEPEEEAAGEAEERAVVATGVPAVLCPFPF